VITGTTCDGASATVRCIVAYCRYCVDCSVLFFSHPRSEGWPHHERTFSCDISVRSAVYKYSYLLTYLLFISVLCHSTGCANKKQSLRKNSPNLQLSQRRIRATYAANYLLVHKFELKSTVF